MSTHPTTRTLRLALAGAVLALASCSTTSRLVGDVTGTTQKQERAQLSTRVQAEVMGGADAFVGEMLDASTRIHAETAEQQLAVLGWQIRQANAAYEIASGANPLEAGLNLALLITLGRSSLDSWWIPEVFGESARPLLAVYASAEPRAWALVGQFTKPDQVARLRSLIADWSRAHPELHQVSSLRVTDLGAVASSSGAGLGTPSEVLQAFGIDPFGWVDPAVQEVQQSRILAERALYFAQRWPRLLELETRQLALQLARQPSSAQLLDDVGRASRAVESAARTAGDLPALVDREREAAIRQFMDAVQAQEGRARALLVDARQALDAGATAATATRGALQAVEAVLQLANAPSPPGTPPGRPFDITEYTQALEQLNRSMGEAQSLLAAMNQDGPRLATLVGEAGREAEARGRALVDHAFRRALLLVLALVGSVLAAAVAYRWASTRLAARARP